MFNIDSMLKLAKMGLDMAHRAEETERQWQFSAKVSKAEATSAERRTWRAEIVKYEQELNDNDEQAKGASAGKHYTEEKRHRRIVNTILEKSLIPLVEKEAQRLNEAIARLNSEMEDCVAHAKAYGDGSGEIFIRGLVGALVGGIGGAFIGGLSGKNEANSAVRHAEVAYNNARAELARCQEELIETNEQLRLYQRKQVEYSFYLAAAYFEQRKYQKALSEFNTALKYAERPSSRMESLRVGILNITGCINSELALREQDIRKKLAYSTAALEAFTASNNLRPDQFVVKTHLSFEGHRYADALRWNDRELELHRRTIFEIGEPGLLDGLILRGRIQVKLNKHADAIVSFKQASRIMDFYSDLTTDEGREQLWVLCATSHHQLGQHVQARNACKKALCLNPRNKEALTILAGYNDAQAQALLGYSHIEKHLRTAVGDYPPSPPKSAAALTALNAAATAGNAFGKCYLGWLYRFGWGVPSNLVRARELFTESHAMGSALGTLSLAMMDGLTTPEGMRLLQQAADRGVPRAVCGFGILHLELLEEARQNNELAKTYIERAAHQGDPFAQNKMGCMYHNVYPGRFRVNEIEAMKWFKKAAKQGHTGGLYNYGLGHKNDWAGPGDKKKAIAYLKAARDAGYADAIPRLEELRTAGFGALVESTPAYCPDPQRLPPLFLEQENNGFQFEPEPEPAPPAAAVPPPPVGAARVPPVAPEAAPVPPPPAGAHAFHREGGGAGGGGDGDPRPMGSI